MLKLGKALSNQNVPTPPVTGATRPSSAGPTQVKQPRKSDESLQEGESFRATVYHCQLKNNASVLKECYQICNKCYNTNKK